MFRRSTVLVWLVLVTPALFAQVSDAAFLVRLQAQLQLQNADARLDGLRDLDAALEHQSPFILADDALKLLDQVLTTAPNPDYADPQSINLPSVRIRALEVMARIKSDKAEPILTRLLFEDRDDKVVEEALRTSRFSVTKPTSRFWDSLGQVFRDNYGSAPHDSLMLVALDTVQFFFDQWQSITNSGVFDGLLRVSQAEQYHQFVRTKAVALLRQLVIGNQTSRS
jgi:HEAT repeat protein